MHNLRPERVVRAFERAGWTVERQRGSHVHLSRPGNPNLLSVPVHKGKPIKIGLLKKLLALAGLSPEEFMELYR
ncbi:MAG: type II toxin-antitoxin system HicA family toxin [Candidatus Tectomicrobia bacterium]|uniref:Type II toxin-antitoxin system HicA family toxin n=1 Tax=Tectimicrobiota bacterium TaxID=2528274 RepID=A0A932ZUC5_UNCTE|nr:type II toxin-antitoxin system HicA family toxin [Candidatus Tectomicrobia bacterium]